MHGLEQDYWGQVDFVYLDREKGANRSVVDQFGIRSQPVFILVAADGTELKRWFGYVTPEDLRPVLDAQVG